MIAGGGGCSLTATRPTQEMSNAEVALKAAKDLNADSLVPEIYRSAVDNYFKAKRDFRLKNFENAKRHALRATRLAEQAEFEAYRMGGATPEASSKLSTPEGGSPDAESTFKEGGTPPPPGGQTGPAAPKQVFKTTMPDAVTPSTGGLMPTTGGGLPSAINDRNEHPSIIPDKGITNYDMRTYETPDKVGGAIRELKPVEIPDLYSNSPSSSGGGIEPLGANANKVQEGFDSLKGQDMRSLDDNTIKPTALGDAPPAEDSDEGDGAANKQKKGKK